MRVPLRGGLSLISPAPLTQPGRLKSCLNYEVTTRDGYSRVAGFLRYDGSSEPGQFRIMKIEGEYQTEPFAAGDAVSVSGGMSGVVISAETDGVVATIYVVTAPDDSLPAVGATVVATVSTAQLLVSSAVAGDAQGLQSDLNAALDTIETTASAAVAEVPGRYGSDVLGIFSVRTKRYAIRDLPRIYFTGGTYLDTQEGTKITINSLDYEVLDVRMLSEHYGFVVYDPTPGYVGTAIAATSGTPVLAAMAPDVLISDGPDSWYGLDDGYQTVPYSDTVTITGGIAPLEYSIVGDTPEDFPLSAVDLSEITTQSESTPAAIWKATTAGWEMVDLGREIAFVDGQPALENFIRSTFLRDGLAPKSTGWFSAPGYASINGVVASTSFDTGDSTSIATNVQCVARNFAPNLPPQWDIVGLSVRIEQLIDGGTAFDLNVSLVGTGVGSENKAKKAGWTASFPLFTQRTYGGELDLWGTHDLTQVIDASAFGVTFQANVVSGTASVGEVALNVHYVERGIKVYIWDGATDVTATLVHYQATSGDALDSDAAGHMTITGIDPHSIRSRQVGAGEQIRTGAAGAGDLLATTAGRDRRIFMAGQQEMDNNRSRYQFIETNFYGDDEFGAVYGVSGAGPAFYFDGSRCIKIRTPMPAGKDIPRHIARQGSSLALGFTGGATIFSRVGDPFEMRGSLGAYSVEVGDRITNLISLTGDALGVLCAESSHALRGQSADTMFKSPISSKRGGLEYTAADMGRVILCDSFGIFAADSEEQFGPAERNYLSVDVEPWLQRRLQALGNGDQSDVRPIAALAVRGKSQYRLFFWDGWILTMTVKPSGIEYTTQRLMTRVVEQDVDRPLPVRALHSMLDENGRERLYASFYGGMKGGYVFELDAGRTFDGEAIPHYVELVPMSAGASAQLDRYDRFWVYGSAHGFSELDASRKSNYGTADNTNAMGFTLGELDAEASTEQAAVRGVVDFPIEGYDVTIRIDGDTSGQGGHSLQMLELVVNPRGVSRGNKG